MQLSIKDIEEKKDKVFHPFVLEFKIESEYDLLDILNRYSLNAEEFYGREFITEQSLITLKNSQAKVYGLVNKLYQEKPYMK